MKAIKIWSIFLLLLIGKKIFAQSFCATEPNVQDILQTIPQSQFKTGGNAYVVRIFIHIIRQSNGTGGQTQSEVNTALSTLVSDYQSHNICFSLFGIDEIKDDNTYNRTSFANDNNGDGKFDDFSPNSHPNAIDIYLFANDKLNFGLASNIPGTALVIGGSAFGSNLASSHMLSHEVGHCLGLFHTFHGLCEGGCAELVNGSNCSTCGDFVCDTHADPKRSQVDQNTCVWNGTTCGVSSTDANGDSYNPDNHIIMAYVPPSCMQYHTAGQGSRMRTTISNSSLLQGVLVPDDLVLTNLTVTSGQDVLYDVQNNITASDLTVESGGNLVLSAGNEIRNLPGSHIKAGSNFHAYINNQCSTIDHNNAAKMGNPNNDNGKPKIKINSTTIEQSDFNLKLFPNPSKDEIKIEYALPSLCSVNISIYDSKGTKISTLYSNRLQQKGNHLIPFSLNDKPNGIYLCVIEIQDFQSGQVKNFQQKFIKTE